MSWLAWWCTVVVLATACSRADEIASVDLVVDGVETIVGADGTVTLLANARGGDGGVASVSVEWGDGSTDALTSGFPGVRLDHTYAEAGSYDVIVVATDAEGATAVASASVDTGPPATAQPPTTTTATTDAATTTTVPPPTTAPTTTVAPTTAAPTTTEPPPPTDPPPPPTDPPTTTTTTTLAPEPQVRELDGVTGGGSDAGEGSSMPFRVAVASWWSSGRVHARAAVGVGATMLTPVASAWVYRDFSALQSDVFSGDATIRYTVDYDGRMTVLASASSFGSVDIVVSVFELADDGVTQGARIAQDVVLTEELDSEIIQAVTSLEFEDSIQRAIDVTLEPGAAYRVRLDLRCEARAFFALGATECTFGSNDAEDTGPFAGIRDLSVTYQP